MDDKAEEIIRGIEKAAVRYSHDMPLRLAIRAIPHIGGEVDMLFAEKGASIQQKRFKEFLEELDYRLKRVEGRLEVPQEDDFYDILINVFEGVLRARTKQKISRYAALVRNQLVAPRAWDQAETAVRILRDLEDVHIELLKAVLGAPVSDAPFNGLKVATLFKQMPEFGKSLARPICERFPNYSETALYLACSELVSKGLLYDEGVGRLSTKAMQYFIATASGQWLIEYIRESGEADI